MGLFDLFKRKDKYQQLLIDGISYATTKIQKTEGKGRDESEYLAICSFIDEIRSRPQDHDGLEALMASIERDYPQHLGDLITYAGWSSGQVKLEPEAEEAMRKRHGKSAAD